MWRLSDSGVEKEKVGQSGSSLSTLKMPRAQQIFVSVAFNNLEFASADTNRGTAPSSAPCHDPDRQHDGCGEPNARCIVFLDVGRTVEVAQSRVGVSRPGAGVCCWVYFKGCLCIAHGIESVYFPWMRESSFHDLCDECA